MRNMSGRWLLGKIRENIRSNIFLQALPYTFLISVLTIAGLFGGFMLGKWWGSSGITRFAFSLIFSTFGFFLGLLISYLVVEAKYPRGNN